MKYIVVDLEMNPVANKNRRSCMECQHEIIEIGAVVLDEQFVEIGSFMTYVRPQYNHKIEKKITRLTGITTQQVQSAPEFEEAFHMFTSWCKSMAEDVQICEWSDSDLRQMTKELNLKACELDEFEEALMESWCDFQQEYGELLSMERQISLEQAMLYAGEDFVGRQHDALYDARNTANLLRIVRGESLKESALSNVIEIMKPSEIGTSLGEMFDFSAFTLSA